MTVRLEIVTPEFFATPLKKLSVEDGPGRIYFVNKSGRIVAVGKPKE